MINYFPYICSSYLLHGFQPIPRWHTAWNLFDFWLISNSDVRQEIKVSFSTWNQSCCDFEIVVISGGFFKPTIFRPKIRSVFRPEIRARLWLWNSVALETSLTNYWQKIMPETSTFMTGSNLSKICQRKACHKYNLYDNFLTNIGLFWRLSLTKVVVSGTVNNLSFGLSLKISQATTSVTKLQWLYSKLVTRVVRKE